MASGNNENHKSISYYLKQFIPYWFQGDPSKVGKSDKNEVVASIPALQLFLDKERFDTRTLSLSTLLERTLGGNGEQSYSSIDHLLGLKPTEQSDEQPGSGLAILLQKVAINEKAGITLGGSIIADCIGTTNEHMVANSQFLAKMQWLYGKRINPKYLNTDVLSGLGDNTKNVTHHLIRALYAGAINIDLMSPATYSLFRLLQKWGGNNGDIVVRSNLVKSPNYLPVLRDLIATNFALLDPHRAKNISTVQYGSTNLIHIDDPNSMGKGLNIVALEQDKSDSYTGISTWREASTVSVIRDVDGVFKVTIDPEQFRQSNKMLFTPSNYWSWLTFSYKNARSVLVSGVPSVVFDQRSFLAHQPKLSRNPTQEQIANAAANAVHADAVNPDGFANIVDGLHVQNLCNKNDLDLVKEFIRSGLADLFVDPPHEDIEPFIDSLAIALTKYLPVSLSRFISLTPPAGQRDHVQVRHIIPPTSIRNNQIITPYGAEALKNALGLTPPDLLSQAEIKLVERDINYLSRQ